MAAALGLVIRELVQHKLGPTLMENEVPSPRLRIRSPWGMCLRRKLNFRYRLMQGSDEQESLREDNEHPVKRQADMGAYVSG